MIILGTNSIKDTGYNVDNSCRFNRPSDDSLTRTFGSSGNRKTWSFSTWIKRCNLINANMNILGTAYTVSSGEAYLLFRSGEQLHYGQYTAGGAAENYSFQTNQAFRDQAAWYNILFVWDTTQSTSSDRMKLYVNGTQVTSFASSTYPSLNLDGVMNSNKGHYIGDAQYGTNLDGYLSETIFVDGTALSPTDVGEFDEDSPTIWKPIDVSGLTFGTNGYYLDYKDSSALGNDVSGNNNDWTVNNLAATDQATDTPTNNFCTLNPLNGFYTAVTFSEGNLDVECTSGSAHGGIGNIGVNTGKWYYEAKLISQSGSASSNSKFGQVGFYNIEATTDDSTNQGLTILADGRVRGQGSTTGSAGSSIWGVGDILMFALDLDNGNMYIGKNGNWRASDGDFDVTFDNASALYSSIATTNSWTFFLRKNVTADNTIKWSLNSGSPSFAISSGNTDANGYGNFEYAVPSGYYSLCTKNLAEFGG